MDYSIFTNIVVSENNGIISAYYSPMGQFLVSLDISVTWPITSLVVRGGCCGYVLDMIHEQVQKQKCKLSNGGGNLSGRHVEIELACEGCFTACFVFPRFQSIDVRIPQHFEGAIPVASQARVHHPLSYQRLTEQQAGPVGSGGDEEEAESTGGAPA